MRRAANTSSTDLLRRNRSPFRQQGHACPSSRPPADYGIRFRRADLGGLEIPAHGHAPRRHSATPTGLTRDAVSVETVEHLLAALVSLGIDNVIVELNSPEVPIMDGSAAPFVYLIQEAGVKTLTAPRRYLKVLRPISLTQRRQAHRALSVGSLQGHLQHQLRPPAAAAPVADDADHRRDVRRGDRAGAHVRLPEGSRDAAPAAAWRSAARSTTPSSSARPAC